MSSNGLKIGLTSGLMGANGNLKLVDITEATQLIITVINPHYQTETRPIYYAHITKFILRIAVTYIAKFAM